MPTISEVRQQYPQYADMSDAALADALHAKYYHDMPADEFTKKVGLGKGVNDNKVDEETGAPAGVRAAVGAMPDNPQDRLQALKKFYPDAKIVGDGNFVYTDPETKTKRLYNPKGLDAGDFASLAPEVAEIAGGTAGAIGGSVAGTAIAPGVGTVAGGMAGAGLGATAAREAVQRAAMKVMGVKDARSTGDQIKDAAMTTVLNAGAQGVGAGVGALVRGGTKMLARGGEAGRKATEMAVSDLERFSPTPTAANPKPPKTTPSVAQATSNAALDTMESFVAKIPGGAGVIRKAAEEQSQKVATAMDAKIAAMNKGTVPDAVAAGNAITGGVERFASDFSDKADVLYGKLDGFLPSDTLIPVSNTERVLGEIVTPAKGAPNVSKTIANPTLVKLQDALGMDASNGAVTYSVMKDLRSAIGRKLGAPSIHDDIPRAELKRVYGALTSDLRMAAQGHGDDAVKAFDRANKYYKAGSDRMDTMLEPLVRNKLPEQAFAAVQSSALQGPTRVIALRKSVSPEQWKAVAGTVAERLGRAKPGYQGIEPDANFSFQNFLSNWQKLPPKTKDALFSGPNMGGMRGDLDALARASDRIRVSSKAFANPSGTGGVAIGGAMLLAAIGSAMTGNLAPLGVATAAMGGSHLGARLLTNPRFVRWLATSTKVDAKGVGGAMARLGNIAAQSDPGTRDAILSLMGGMKQHTDESDKARGGQP